MTSRMVFTRTVWLIVVSVAALILSGCGSSRSTPAQSGAVESVMEVGESITVTNSFGKLVVRALSPLGREYEWNGASRKVTMQPRKTRWDGSLGLYFPGPGDHWDEHDGVTRGLLNEGILRFTGEKEFREWLKDRENDYLRFVYRNDGLVVGWGKYLPRRTLSVEVWQIMISDAIPTKIEGSNDDLIQRVRVR